MNYRDLEWRIQNINQSLYLQNATHISPSWAGYWVSVARILENIGRVITASHDLQKYMYMYAGAPFTKIVRL